MSPIHIFYDMVAEPFSLKAAEALWRQRLRYGAKAWIDEQADDRVQEAAGEYQWDDRSGGDADKDVQGEATSKYSWSDEKKTVSIYIELDGLDDVVEEAFRAGAGDTDVSITIASVAGKQRMFRLTGLANEIAGVKVAQKKGKQLIDEFVDEEMKQNAENLKHDLAFHEKLADNGMMAAVDMRGIDEAFDDVEQMTAELGAKGIAEDLCAGGNEELAQGCRVCVEDFGSSRAETNEAGLLDEDKGVEMDTFCYVAKEKHQQCLRCETCSRYVNKSYFSFWDSPGVDLDFVENGADEFDVARDAWRDGAARECRSVFIASAQTVLEASAQEQSAEDGNMKSGYMESRDRELVDSGSGYERGTRVDDGERRRETTTGEGNKRIYVRQGKKIRQMSEEELVEWVENGGGNAYAVHNGKIVTAEMISRLKDCVMIRLVNRLPGGGRKKKAAPRNKGESDMSATDESSSSTLSSERLSLITGVNEVFGSEAVEQMKTIAYNGQGGWVEAWARKIMEVGEEKEEEVLGYLCGMARVECGDVGAETMIGEIRKFIREQRRVEKDRRMKDEQEERRRRWEKDGEMWEPAGRESGKETVEDARGNGLAVVEETGKGWKGVGMSGGWFWQTAQQGKARQEAAQQQQHREGEAVRQRQQEEAAQQQWQQEEGEQEATRQQQQEEAEWEAARRQQRQQEEERRSAGGTGAEEGARGARGAEESAGGARGAEESAGGARGAEESAGGARGAEESAGGARGAEESAGGARAEESAGGAREEESAGGARRRESSGGARETCEREKGSGGAKRRKRC